MIELFYCLLISFSSNAIENKSWNGFIAGLKNVNDFDCASCNI